MTTLYDRLRGPDSVDGTITSNKTKIPSWPFMNDLWLLFEGYIDVAAIATRWSMDASQTAELGEYLTEAQTRLANGWDRTKLFHHLWHVCIASERGVLSYEQSRTELLKGQ